MDGSRWCMLGALVVVTGCFEPLRPADDSAGTGASGSSGASSSKGGSNGEAFSGVAPPVGEHDRRGVPEGVELPPPDPWLDEVYAPVLERARDLDAEGLTQLYPSTAATGPLGYDPLDAPYIDRLSDFVDLRPGQRETLAREGFVAVEGSGFETFTENYEQAYEADLPILITTDSVLHAWHRSFVETLRRVEQHVFIALATTMLEDLHARLIAEVEAGRVPDALVPAMRDLDMYLVVARRLIAGGLPEPAYGDEVRGWAQWFHERIVAESTTTASVTLFGANYRDFDFSQFRPRGHYATTTSLRNYFRAMVWMARADFAMVVFDELGRPHFNRRATEAALALGVLLRESEAESAWEGLAQGIDVLMGDTDSMDARDLERLLTELGIESLEQIAERDDGSLYTAIMHGEYGMQRIMSQVMMTKPMAPPIVLPRVFHLMGQRYTIDAHVFHNVTFDRLPARRAVPSELDPMFVLGNERALDHLTEELDRFAYAGPLYAMRELADAHPDEFWRSSVYNAWLSAIRGVHEPQSDEARPAVFRRAAWRDKSLNTQLAAWAELRHDTILYTKQSFTGGAGCEYPDAYVEPYPDVYSGLADVAAFVGTFVESVAGSGVARDWGIDELLEFLPRFADTMITLEAIAQRELDGESLSEEQWQFLRGTIKKTSIGCDGSPAFSGWYGDLFLEPEATVEFEPVAVDVHTAPIDWVGRRHGAVKHAATGVPMYMLLTIDDCAGPRAFVGPISSFHAPVRSNYDRLDNARWKQMLEGGNPPRPDWTRSFMPPAARR